jgi:choline dehydrogenase-like flavoprotein
VTGLYVTDAAALPSNTGANPQITIMANALRIAEGIAAPRSRVALGLADPGGAHRAAGA